MKTDPTALTASEALPRLRDGSLSAEAYARACLERIGEHDRQVRAWAHVDPDLVIEQARALDRRQVKGPLHGLPVGVKDIMLTKDIPTHYNSEIYRGAHPGMDAACVSLLRVAGALVLGKTETVEFGAIGAPAPTRTIAAATPRKPVRGPRSNSQSQGMGRKGVRGATSHGAAPPPRLRSGS